MIIRREGQTAENADHRNPVSAGPDGNQLIFAYAAVNIFAAAANRAKNLTYGKLIEQIRSNDGFDTILGHIKFDKKGDVVGVKHDFFILTEQGIVPMNTRPPPPPPPH